MMKWKMPAFIFIMALVMMMALWTPVEATRMVDQPGIEATLGQMTVDMVLRVVCAGPATMAIAGLQGQGAISDFVAQKIDGITTTDMLIAQEGLMIKMLSGPTDAIVKNVDTDTLGAMAGKYVPEVEYDAIKPILRQSMVTTGIICI